MNVSTRRGFLATGMGALGGAAASQGATATPAPCKIEQSLPVQGVQTGGARTVQVDGKYTVWVKHIGPQSGKQVLTLHGGPGFPHFYLECLEDFLPQAGIGYWYYDQLGCGFSDQPKDNSLWTVGRFREEVEQVRKALGLDKFILFGHSWGSMLAIEYALKYQQHLSGLVLSNMTASIDRYVARLDGIRAALPPKTRERFEQFEAQQAFTSPEYEALLFEELYRKHLCRLDPWPDPIQRSLRGLALPVYNTMQGPDEFHVTGNFRKWDRWKDLPQIRVPTLCIGARHDTMDPEDIVRMGKLMPKGQSFICPNGSHTAMYDEQQVYFSALMGFLEKL